MMKMIKNDQKSMKLQLNYENAKCWRRARPCCDDVYTWVTIWYQANTSEWKHVKPASIYFGSFLFFFSCSNHLYFVIFFHVFSCFPMCFQLFLHVFSCFFMFFLVFNIYARHNANALLLCMFISYWWNGYGREHIATSSVYFFYFLLFSFFLHTYVFPCFFMFFHVSLCFFKCFHVSSWFFMFFSCVFIWVYVFSCFYLIVHVCFHIFSFFWFSFLTHHIYKTKISQKLSVMRLQVKTPTQEKNFAQKVLSPTKKIDFFEKKMENTFLAKMQYCVDICTCRAITSWLSGPQHRHIR